MSIFGTLHSKISSSNYSVELYYSTLSPEYIVNDEIQFTSQLTGFRSYDKKLHYSEFTINVNVFKKEDSINLINTLYSMKNSNDDFYFYPHVDSNEPIKNIFNESVKFKITDIQLYYLTNLDFYELIKVTLKSKQYTYLKFGDTISQGYGTKYGIGEYGLSGW